ncbi:unnamed protein product [Cochlearia groenlandica]
MAEGMRSRSNGLNERLEALEAVAAVRNAQIRDMVEALRLMNMMKSSNVERYDLGKSDLQCCLDRLEVSIREKEKTIELKMEVITSMKMTDSSSILTVAEYYTEAKSSFVTPSVQAETVTSITDNILYKEKPSIQVLVYVLEPSLQYCKQSLEVYANSQIRLGFEEVFDEQEHGVFVLNGVKMNDFYKMGGGVDVSHNAHEVFDEMTLQGYKLQQSKMKSLFPKSWMFKFKPRPWSYESADDKPLLVERSWENDICFQIEAKVEFDGRAYASIHEMSLVMCAQQRLETFNIIIGKGTQDWLMKFGVKIAWCGYGLILGTNQKLSKFLTRRGDTSGTEFHLWHRWRYKLGEMVYGCKFKKQISSILGMNQKLGEELEMIKALRRKSKGRCLSLGSTSTKKWNWGGTVPRQYHRFTT